MAIKKSELYSTLRESCNELRGGMDASQYKDYVLTLLFIKYVSDKYAWKDDAVILIPEGASFADMVALKGDAEIGDKINKLVHKIAKANDLQWVIDLTDFNDEDKLGKWKEMVDLLSKLIGLFENPGLDFSSNRADGDDIIGDAYEYLMRHFATESGKSKGQFYTPAEVSRVLAKVIEVWTATSNSYTVYDPTCGSGSLLLKVADEAPVNLSLYGQEKDNATSALAIQNMRLHWYEDAEIRKWNTIADPKFIEDDKLKRFDYVVANPPFSVKNWTNWLNAEADHYDRFTGFGIPPAKNGDYAFLLHIVRSLKSTGKGAVILPHGVLFRGNAEATIRQNLIKKGYIKGIIWLPANLFYGTWIPACIIVLDKEDTDRDSIFMIDASKGFIKDGNKNRLREQDVHKIVDTFVNQNTLEKYARSVPLSEIEANDYNLNIPRYIDTQEEEDIQDLEAHLQWWIPTSDIDSLAPFWQAYHTMRQSLFTPLRDWYVSLIPDQDSVRDTIFSHPEFVSYRQELDTLFNDWKASIIPQLEAINDDTRPKKLIHSLWESILQQYASRSLIDEYVIYQHLMDYREETMKDDAYMIVENGRETKPYRVIVKDKKGKEKDKGRACDLLPKSYIVNAFFAEQQTSIQELEQKKETVSAQLEEQASEHSWEDGFLAEVTSDTGNISKWAITKRIKEIKNDADSNEELTVLTQYSILLDEEKDLKKQIKDADVELDILAYRKYDELTSEQVKELVIHSKWIATLADTISTQIDNISQNLANRIGELAQRYESPLPVLEESVEDYEKKVHEHLTQMGFTL